MRVGWGSNGQSILTRRAWLFQNKQHGALCWLCVISSQLTTLCDSFHPRVIQHEEKVRPSETVASQIAAEPHSDIKPRHMLSCAETRCEGAVFWTVCRSGLRCLHEKVLMLINLNHYFFSPCSSGVRCLHTHKPKSSEAALMSSECVTECVCLRLWAEKSLVWLSWSATSPLGC